MPLWRNWINSPVVDKLSLLQDWIIYHKSSYREAVPHVLSLLHVPACPSASLPLAWSMKPLVDVAASSWTFSLHNHELNKFLSFIYYLVTGILL